LTPAFGVALAVAQLAMLLPAPKANGNPASSGITVFRQLPKA